MTRFIKLLNSVLLILHLTSCTMSDNNMAELKLDIPSLPEQFQTIRIESYRVAVTSCGRQKTFNVSGDTLSVKIKIPSDEISAVTVYPECGYMELKPAGVIAVSPGNKNQLSWNDGFAAETVSVLLKAGCHLDGFNFQLFREKLMSESDSDPWLLDRENIIYAMRYNIFSSTYIKKLETHPIELNFPEFSGKWCRNTPGNPEYYEKTGSILEIPYITTGENIFFNSEKNIAISIFADAFGWVAISSDSTVGLSGNW